MDQAETDAERAYSVNADAVQNLALICKQENTWLIHYSTDYVFDGPNNLPMSRTILLTRSTSMVNPSGQVRERFQKLIVSI